MKEKFDKNQPVYECPPQKYTAEQIIRILVDPDKSKICHVKPTSVTETATYVVDIHSLQNAENVKKDELRMNLQVFWVTFSDV